MTLLRRAAALIDRMNFAGAVFAAAALCLLALLLIVEVATTGLVNYSQPWAVEYASYLLAAAMLCGAGWTLGDGGHMRVRFVSAERSPRIARVLEYVASLAGLAMAAFIAAALIGMALRSHQLGSRSYFPMQTPLVWPQLVVASGFVLLTLGFVARLIRLALGEEFETPTVDAFGAD